MKKIILLCCIGLGLGLSAQRAAAVDTYLSSFRLWSTMFGVDVVRVIPNDAAVVNVGCTDSDSYLVSAALSADAKKRTYATLLSAKLSGTQVRITISGCEMNRPAITGAIME